VHARFELLFERPTVPAHPEHHLDDQARGDQHHRKLEIFERFVGQQRSDAEHHDCQRQGKTDTGGNTTPQITHSDRRVGAALQPRVEDAHDQHGLG
jgi:hypothetical protein